MNKDIAYICRNRKESIFIERYIDFKNTCDSFEIDFFNSLKNDYLSVNEPLFYYFFDGKAKWGVLRNLLDDNEDYLDMIRVLKRIEVKKLMRREKIKNIL